MSIISRIRRVTRECSQYFSWLMHNKKMITVAVIVALALPLWVVVQIVILPATSCGKGFPSGDTISEPHSLSDSIPEEEYMHYAREIGRMEREKAYLHNLISLARQDSVYMALNLADSTLRLQIKGVTVRTTKLHGIQVTRRLRCLNEGQLLHWVSSPFMANRDMSTIPKIRYIIKEAPKDTAEASGQSTQPLMPDTSAVHFTLYFDRHLVVEINQLPDSASGDPTVIEAYLSRKRETSRKEALHALLHFTYPPPEMLIRLSVTKADARAIYRGTPVFPRLALKVH